MGAKVRPDGQTRDKVRALYEQGMTRNEIAAALGVSNQAVQYHVQKIRESEPRERAS